MVMLYDTKCEYEFDCESVCDYVYMSVNVVIFVNVSVAVPVPVTAAVSVSELRTPQGPGGLSFSHLTLDAGPSVKND